TSAHSAVSVRNWSTHTRKSSVASSRRVPSVSGIWLTRFVPMNIAVVMGGSLVTCNACASLLTGTVRTGAVRRSSATGLRMIDVAPGQDHLRHADGQVAVAAGARLHVAVAVADGLRDGGIDDDGARAATARLLEDRHHVDVRHGRIAAPDQKQPRVLRQVE